MAFPQPEIAAPSSGVTAPVGLLLAGKLEPPVFGHARLIRPRLLSVLTRGIAHTPVTLISGPAGSGKTELAASWMQANADRRAVAWLSLDEADDDPGMFWTYVAEALSGAGVDLDGVPRPPAGEPVPPGFLTVLASRLLAGSRPVVLVLDNSDCLTHPDICRPLDALVRNAGRRLRLVLCARADPQLPLHQYRVSDSLTEIRRDSLAFTPEETRDLLARLGAAVPADVVTDLQARTEGWAVGVRLAAAPLKQGMDPEHLVASLADQDGSVAQYLFAEVLAHQPASVRRFLLRISVTPELWPALVERLTGWNNGRRMLASLAHANAFVEQSPHVPGGYRIHPVPRDAQCAAEVRQPPGDHRAAPRVRRLVPGGPRPAPQRRTRWRPGTGHWSQHSWSTTCAWPRCSPGRRIRACGRWTASRPASPDGTPRSSGWPAPFPPGDRRTPTTWRRFARPRGTRRAGRRSGPAPR